MRLPVDRDGVLVIGYGSSLRGDDAMGPAAARRLREYGFEALAVHQLTPEIAERVAAARAVYFLDAAAGVPPGEISIQPLERAATRGPQPMGHHASPAALLRLARDAFGANPGAWLIGMGGSSFEIGGDLSEAAERAVSRAIEEVVFQAGPRPGRVEREGWTASPEKARAAANR